MCVRAAGRIFCIFGWISRKFWCCCCCSCRFASHSLCLSFFLFCWSWLMSFSYSINLNLHLNSKKKGIEDCSTCTYPAMSAGSFGILVIDINFICFPQRRWRWRFHRFLRKIEIERENSVSIYVLYSIYLRLMKTSLICSKCKLCLTPRKYANIFISLIREKQNEMEYAVENFVAK